MLIKSLLVVLVGVVCFFAGYFFFKNQAQILLPLGTTPPTITAPSSSLQTYRNLPYNFAFSYPETFGFTTVNAANLADKVVQIELPAAVFPKTNFADAAIAISVQFATSSVICQTVGLQNQEKTMLNTITVGGQTWQGIAQNDAGAGNLYESKVYRTYRAPNCFEMVEMIHTTNVANYLPVVVPEVDKAAVWKKLDDVVNTFHFDAQ